MESYLLDWANLLLRWVHVVTAIAWVGSSFYFVFLDNSLTPPVDEDLRRQGVSGELWVVSQDRAYPREDAIMLSPHIMNTLTRQWSRDPLAVPSSCRNATV